jgi:hypothetical protein
MEQSRMPTRVLLVGSVPLSSTEAVFTKVCTTLPGRLHCTTDGETGERDNFVRWQQSCFPKEAIYERFGGSEAPENSKPEFALESIILTRYDEAALSSYAEFQKLRADGVIPKDVRFQVCLPTPINPVQLFVKPQYREQIEPLYEQRMLEALRRIQEEIPAKELAIQWEMAFDIAAMEYDRGRVTSEFSKAHYSPVKEGILNRVTRISAAIRADVELGFHLRYGDSEHKYFIEPIDTSLLVEMANEILKRVSKTHHVRWIYMPVPKRGSDVAYFEPLKRLKLCGAQLFLGLVHANDEDGARERIKTAQSVCPHPFGVATKCGMGRTPKKDLDSILQISCAVTAPYRQGLNRWHIRYHESYPVLLEITSTSFQFVPNSTRHSRS